MQKRTKSTAIANRQAAIAKAHEQRRTVRGKGELIAGTTKVRYTCEAGHTTVEDFNKGKPKHLRADDVAIRMLTRHWSNSVVYFHCPECFRRK